MQNEPGHVDIASTVEVAGNCQSQFDIFISSVIAVLCSPSCVISLASQYYKYIM